MTIQLIQFSILRNIIKMDKLSQITIDNTLNLVVNCQVDQHLLAKNFTTIVEILKQMKAAQKRTDAQVSELNNLGSKLSELNQKMDRIQKYNGSSSKQSTSNSNSNNQDVGHLEDLIKRTGKNESNIIDSIKDINLINKELSDAKRSIEDLKNSILQSSGKGQREVSNSYGVSDIASNVSKQLQQSSERIKDLEGRLGHAEDKIKSLESHLKDLSNNDSNKDKVGQLPASSSTKDKELDELKRDLRQKLDVMNKKINNLQADNDDFNQEISLIKDTIADLKHDNNNQAPSTNLDGNSQASSSEINDLRRKIDQVDKRENKDVKNIHEEINNLKKLLKQMEERLHNQEQKSLTQDESKGKLSNRKSTIQKDDLSDKVSDLVNRVIYLEKLFGSKNNLTDEKNPEKLPAINRSRPNNLTGFNNKEKSSGIGRKDLSQLKSDLQAWIRGLLDQNKDHQSLEEMYMKIQELKQQLQKKADAEGTKKGFNFLENKITQLYLFLTEPETEDAMIVRKGFNCLSCSKRVEKLRGRLGPRLNWNNMTTTNYSPPRVGYSKPMGEQSSIEKEDDL